MVEGAHTYRGSGIEQTAADYILNVISNDIEVGAPTESSPVLEAVLEALVLIGPFDGKELSVPVMA